MNPSPAYIVADVGRFNLSLSDFAEACDPDVDHGLGKKRRAEHDM
jgi:hypothetical protein